MYVLIYVDMYKDLSVAQECVTRAQELHTRNKTTPHGLQQFFESEFV